VTPSEPVATETRKLDGADLAFEETLELARFGDIEVYANPLDIHQTRCRFFLPVGRTVSLTIRDLHLDPVATLLDGYKAGGMCSVRWRGLDDEGLPVAAGIYWAVLDVEGSARSDLLLVDQDVPAPDNRVYGWTISSSDTDPFSNSDASTTGTFRHLYVWLVCGGDVQHAEFRLECTFPVLAFVPTFPFPINYSVFPEVALVTVGCPTGPVIAATLTVMDNAAGGRVCFVPSEANDRNMSFSCPEYDPWPNAFIGYSNDGAPSCRSAISAPCGVGGD
jgi:hypothetical protein